MRTAFALVLSLVQTLFAFQSGPCKFQFQPPSGLSVDGNDRLISLRVTASYPTCKWDARSYASWVKVISPGEKSGDGSVGIAVDLNEGSATRDGSVVIAGNNWTIRQSGGGQCLFSGNNGSTTVESYITMIGHPITVLSRSGFPNGCRWAAKSNVGWIRVTNSASGELHDYVNLQLDVNQSEHSRTGGVSISGGTLTVTQRGRIVPNVSAVVNGASFEIAKGIAPGSLFSIFGTGFADWQRTAPPGMNLPTTLGSVSVLVNGKLAPLYHVGPRQINGQLPRRTAIGEASVVVTNDSYKTTSSPQPVTVVEASPGLFQCGGKRACVQNQDYRLNSMSDPAPVASVVMAYLTGAGWMMGDLPDGVQAPLSPLIVCGLPVTATIGGVDADVLFAGLAPSFVGLVQINIRVPEMPSGDYELVLSVGGVASNPGIISIGNPNGGAGRGGSGSR